MHNVVISFKVGAAAAAAFLQRHPPSRRAHNFAISPIERSGLKAVVFTRTGHVNVVGCRQFEAALGPTRRVLEAAFAISLAPGDIRVVNSTCSFSFGHPRLDLGGLQAGQSRRSPGERLFRVSSRTQQFPAATLRPLRLGAGCGSAILFASGKAVVVGAPSLEAVERLLKEVAKILAPHCLSCRAGGPCRAAASLSTP